MKKTIWKRIFVCASLLNILHYKHLVTSFQDCVCEYISMCVCVCAYVCMRCYLRKFIWVWLHSLAYNISSCALILRDVNYCLGLQFIILIKLPYKNTYKTNFCLKNILYPFYDFFWVKRIPLKQELLQLDECKCISRHIIDAKKTGRVLIEILLCIISCSLIVRL